MNRDYIEIELSLDDYKKVMNLDGFDIERKLLQTSGAQYIHISLRPECSKREDINMKWISTETRLPNTVGLYGVTNKSDNFNPYDFGFLYFDGIGFVVPQHSEEVFAYRTPLYWAKIEMGKD